MAHLAGRRPFGELDFGDEFRSHPRRDGLILHSHAKGRGRRFAAAESLSCNSSRVAWEKPVPT